MRALGDEVQLHTSYSRVNYVHIYTYYMILLLHVNVMRAAAVLLRELAR